MANQEKFIRDEVRIMVATVAFGMGINKPNVRFVIHHDLPKSLEQYYQEIGRAGRDGEEAHALLLYGYGDTRKIRFFMEDKSVGETRKAEAHLKGMTSYAEGSTCRRSTLLSYFGEAYTPKEGLYCCDVCSRGVIPLTDLTVPVQKILSCIIRCGERYGAAYIVDVLMGSRQKRILENGHDKLSTWGIGTEFPKEGWAEIIRLLVEKEYLYKDDEFSVLSLSETSRSALAGRTSIHLPFMPATPASAGDSDGYTKTSLKFPKKTRTGIDPADSTAVRILSSLKTLRRGLAEAASVPPYVIFSDKTLEDIAVKKPADRGDLLDIYGIGAVKAERYGVFIMKAVKGEQ
jgi:ATP-dependent DNA helicase RecQ